MKAAIALTSTAVALLSVLGSLAAPATSAQPHDERSSSTDFDKTITLVWPNFTQVNPITQHQSWAGGYGDWSYANFVTEDNGFQAEEFELVIWAGEGEWNPPLNADPIDKAKCTISASGPADNLEEYALLQQSPYVESVWPTPNPVGTVTCTKE